MRYVMAAMLAGLLAAPAMAAQPLSDVQMDQVAAGAIGVLAGLPGAVTVITTDSSNVSGVPSHSSASVTVSE